MTTLDQTELILSGSAQNISSADIDRQNLQFLIYGYETSNDPFYPELAPEVPTALQRMEDHTSLSLYPLALI